MLAGDPGKVHRPAPQQRAGTKNSSWQCFLAHNFGYSWVKQCKTPGILKELVEPDEHEFNLNIMCFLTMCLDTVLGFSHGFLATWIQDLREAWEEFAAYADLSMRNNPLAGESCMKIERNHADNDWLIQHSKCSQEDSVVHQGADGKEVCQRCFDNASDQRWLDEKPSFIFFPCFSLG